MADYTWDPTIKEWRIPFNSHAQFEHLQTYIRMKNHQMHGIDTSDYKTGTVRVRTEKGAQEVAAALKRITF